MDEREKLKRAAEDAVFQISKLSSRFSGDTSSNTIKTSDEEDMEDMLAPPSFQVKSEHTILSRKDQDDSATSDAVDGNDGSNESDNDASDQVRFVRTPASHLWLYDDARRLKIIPHQPRKSRGLQNKKTTRS